MKKNLLLAIILVLILVTASILLQQTNAPTETASAQIEETKKHERIVEITIEKNVNGEITSGDVLITFEDPPILPVNRETALGVFLGREEDLLTLGTGSIKVEIGVEVVNDEDPVNIINISYTGDPVDIKISAKTVIYKDITEIPDVTVEDLNSGKKLVTREVVPGSLEELGENMVIRVWGNVDDGKVLADVLVYELIQ